MDLKRIFLKDACPTSIGGQAIMEGIMMDTMYEIPSDDSITNCMITKEVVEGTGTPVTASNEIKARA